MTAHHAKPSHESKLDEKRVDWLKEYFEAVTASSDRLLALFGVLVVSAIAISHSASNPLELPFLKVDVGREILFGCTILTAAFTAIAFFGNYDQGEVALTELSTVLGCQYEDLWFVDTHPTVIDFARFRRHESAVKRRYPARVINALLYPMVILGALAWLSFLLVSELYNVGMSLYEMSPYILAIPTLLVAWNRAAEYFSRRWDTFQAVEESRSQA